MTFLKPQINNKNAIFSLLWMIVALCAALEAELTTRHFETTYNSFSITLQEILA